MESKKRMINVYRRVYSIPRLARTLKILGALAVFYVAGVFVYGVGNLLWVGQYLYAAELVSVAAVPFIAVTLMRYFINAERPYEVFDIDELKALKEKGKKGHSFPSRHVFSAFLIGVLFIPYGVAFGIAALLLGAFIAVERVLLGIHFVRDVLVGAVIGALSGLVGVLIL